jgi:creatinine amidohydrolase/Fe(II)-dependent formamide hydrolase-like protein
VVELPGASDKRASAPRVSLPEPSPVLAISIDTAVEEHGPHLPLATDRFQSYAVLCRAAEALSRDGVGGIMLGPPLDYGHLVWGLAFGLSIDIPPPLLSRYVARFAEAVVAWSGARSLYVVDVHGSLAHRQAIQAGLAASGIRHWKFRWLFEPLMPFAGERGDQHAGGVETVVIHAISSDLVDRAWWPARRDELRRGQMSYETAVELTPDLPRFFAYARDHEWNGIVGKIENADTLEGQMLLEKMVEVARDDLRHLAGIDTQ